MVNSLFLWVNLSIANLMVALIALGFCVLVGIETNYVQVYLVLEFVTTLTMLALLFLPSAATD